MKVYRSILSTLLALLVLMSSTSFMVGMHICMGDVQSVALFSKAESCEMEKKLPPCHRHIPAPCCEDEALVYSADDFQTTPTSPELVTPTLMDATPLVLVSELVPDTPLSQIQYRSYDPPLRFHNLNVEHRVFRI